MTRPTVDSESLPTSDTAGPSAHDRAPGSRRRPTRTGNLHAGLIIAAVVLVLLVVFLAQNAHAVTISFFGAHLHVSLAVALLTAAVAGALIVGVAGTARITQLRLHTRRAARRHDETRGG